MDIDIKLYIAKKIAGFQWNQEYTEKQLISQGTKTSRIQWEAARAEHWRDRLTQIGQKMITAEKIAVFLCAILAIDALMLDKSPNLESAYFSHWWDLLALPALVGIDRFFDYITKDSGENTNKTIFTVSRVVFILLGIACGFLAPLFITMSLLILLFILPYILRRIIAGCRYW